MQPGHCADGDNVQIVPGAINCVLDFLILMLVRKELLLKVQVPDDYKPITLLWRLRTSVPQKGALTVIFIIAGL